MIVYKLLLQYTSEVKVINLETFFINVIPDYFTKEITHCLPDH